MKYKNIVFDFGNVIGKFNGRDLVKHFSSCEEDQELLFTAIFSRWDDIDNGSVDYEQNIDNIAASLPDRLESAVRTLFREWPRHLTPINDTLRFIDELKERNIPLYLLSNAPTYFAEYAVNYDFLKEFSGIVFSAPLKMAKPDPAIYRYLFETFSLDPKECFFIDDLEKKYQCRAFSWYGRIVFNGNIDDVKKRLVSDLKKPVAFLAVPSSVLLFLFRFLFGFYVFQISDTFRFCFFLLFRARSKQFCHHCNDSSCCDKEIREIICDPFQMFIFQAKSHIIYNVSANEPIEHITDRACRHQ